MKIFHRIPLILGLAIVFTLTKWASFIFAEDNIRDRPTLQGLKGVHVMVEPLDPEIEQGGLSRAQIKTDVELRLRMAGIKVLSREESYEIPGRPHLRVMITVLSPKLTKAWAYFFSIHLDLLQDVYLIRYLNRVSDTYLLEERGPPNYIGNVSTTWSVNLIGLLPTLIGIRAPVKDTVDIFINAYLSVNPKSTGR